MAQKLNDKSTNDPKSTPLDSTDAQTSILVLISARAIGSLGFAVSLLAIWFGWLLPASLTASDTSEIKKPRLVPKHRRRSASSPTGAPITVQQRSALVDLAPILVPHPGEISSRHVSFADSPSTAVVRRNTLPEPRKLNNFLASSISTIPHHPSPSPSRPGTPPNACLDDPNVQDSDSSLSRPSRLRKLKLGFNLKTNRPLPADKQFDRDSITSVESTASENVMKRSNNCNSGFVAAWSNSRARTAGDDSDQGFASPSRLSVVRLLSPSTPATATKTERRRSTPIPRTYPYGAPYFASPPVLLDKNAYPSYLKTLPQFEDEVTGKVSLTQNPGRKRRSASEDWTVRPLIN